jgi:hypothetical protein
MELILKRKIEVNNAVIGQLFIDGKFICYTLEDKIRDVKIKHETCIPAGKYPIVMTMSQRFKMVLPLLQNVPNFDSIRIHAGNYADKETFLKNVKIGKNILTDSKIRIEVI